MNLITIKELSEYLKIKQSTLYSWASSGMIPSYKLNGVLRFDKDEIEGWIKTRKVQPFRHPINFKKNPNLEIDNIIRRTIDEVRGKKRRA